MLSRVVFCSSILYGLTVKYTRNISRTIKACTRIIHKQIRTDYSGVTRIMIDNNILDISSRSRNRLLTNTRHTLDKQIACYIQESISPLMTYSGHQRRLSANRYGETYRHENVGNVDISTGAMEHSPKQESNNSINKDFQTCFLREYVISPIK